DGGEIEVWGDGTAVRSYTHVNDMVDGIYLLMQSDLHGAVNIGCPQYVTVNELVETVSKISGKQITIKHIKGPVGVQSRNFSNARIYSTGWKANYQLADGIAQTYPWIAAQVKKYWDCRPFSRVVAPGRDARTMDDYIRLNEMEAFGMNRAEARFYLALEKADKLELSLERCAPSS
ncbi:MAG: NAD-dependent epimerase/dehydratase family protein, partial [Bdellovibrionota bacterium]